MPIQETHCEGKGFADCIAAENAIYEQSIGIGDGSWISEDHCNKNPSRLLTSYKGGVSLTLCYRHSEDIYKAFAGAALISLKGNKILKVKNNRPNIRNYS